MSSPEIIQNSIRSLGQSQSGRLPAALKSDFVNVDERTVADYLELLKKLAAEIRFYETSNANESNWSSFFPFSEEEASIWFEGLDDRTPPHLGLLLAFLQLYKEPQALMNDITERHLDFYYQQILKLKKKEAIPDHAHVAITLKKGVDSQLIKPAFSLSAGKDSTGIERIYLPVRESIINQSEVAAIKSLYRDPSGILRYAPIANSIDGLGTVEKGLDISWSGFGHDALPAAEVGFAIASPVLQMAEGNRTISVRLSLANVNLTTLNEGVADQAFAIYLTGEKSWLGPYTVTPIVTQSEMRFSVIIHEEDDAVVNYQADTHGYSYASVAPVMQVLLNKENAGTPYDPFQGLVLHSLKIDVDVQGVRSLNLSNDFGSLNAKKKFTPFGPEPKVGSRFVVGCKEAFSKMLTEVSVKLPWVDVPADLATHHSGYGRQNGERVNNDWFTASVSFADGANWESSVTAQQLFKTGNASQAKIIKFTNSTGSNLSNNPASSFIYTLLVAKNTWAKTAMNQMFLANPVQSLTTVNKVEPVEGEMIFSLNNSFLHDVYRKKYVENVVEFSKGTATELVLLNEPVIPSIQDISLNYKASSGTVDMLTGTAESFADGPVQFFHIGYFGQMRDHRYVREQFDFVADKQVSLLSDINVKGELLVGLTELVAGESVSILFQVAEGSADPDLSGADITWSVLCDNYWKSLTAADVVLDTTNQLLISGLITFLIPGEATTTNSLLPPGYIWIKAALDKDVSAVCKINNIIANVIEVVFDDQGNATDHLETSLPAKSIFKFKAGMSSVKKVSQPYASLGGAANESRDGFNTRVSERLRHKGRCITPWDYERVVLERFPKLHKVKCIPHAMPGSWAAPGHMMLVLVPNLSNQNAVDPLQPRVDSNTLLQVEELSKSRASMQIQIHASNPKYSPVTAHFKVKFHRGFEFNYYRQQLNKFLIQTLSPWVFDSSEEIEFGGSIYDSVLLNKIEELEYVDFVSDFSLSSVFDDNQHGDKGQIRAVTPDAILVSALDHMIEEYTG